METEKKKPAWSEGRLKQLCSQAPFPCEYLSVELRAGKLNGTCKATLKCGTCSKTFTRLVASIARMTGQCTPCDRKSRKGKVVNWAPKKQVVVHTRDSVMELCSSKGCVLKTQGDTFYRTGLLQLLCPDCGCIFEKTLYNLGKSKAGTCRPCAMKRKGKESRLFDQADVLRRCEEKECVFMSHNSSTGIVSKTMLLLKCKCGKQFHRQWSNFSSKRETGLCGACLAIRQQNTKRKNCIEKYDQPFPPNKGIYYNENVLTQLCKDAPNQCEYLGFISTTVQNTHDSRVNLRCQCGSIFSRKASIMRNMTGLCNQCNAINLMDSAVMYKKKQFVFPSGRIDYVQGYEHFCLRDLLNSGVPEDDIVTGIKHVPTIKYTFGCKQRNYHPDIHIKSTNTLIEVKSEYTAKMHIEKDKAKWSAAALIYTFELRIYDAKGHLLRRTQVPVSTE
jgi:hypothetical protein